MKFTERIQQLRKERQIPQRKLAAALEIDTATYCKFEKGERRTKKEYIPLIAELLETDKDELLTLWIAEQVLEVVEDEKELAGKVLKIAQQKLFDKIENP